MTDIQIVVGDYTASNADSYLAYLDELSRTRNDGGLLHGGHIHYIQGNFEGMILKAAINMTLDMVPEVFPLDLPEIVNNNPEYEPTEAMQKAITEINEGLLMPIGGGEILEIIELARKYTEGIND